MYTIHRFDIFSEKEISEYNIWNLIMVNSDYYFRNKQIKSNPVTGDLENHKKREIPLTIWRSNRDDRRKTYSQ